MGPDGDRRPLPSRGSPTNRTCPSGWSACVKEASQLDSAALIIDTVGGHTVASATGPLAEGLFNLTAADLESLSSLVDEIRSCYTGSDALGRGFIGTESLSEWCKGGGGASPVGPPNPGGQLVLAHSRPVQLTCEEIRPLEMLADHVASALVSSGRSGSYLPN